MKTITVYLALIFCLLLNFDITYSGQRLQIESDKVSIENLPPDNIHVNNIENNQNLNDGKLKKCIVTIVIFLFSAAAFVLAVIGLMIFDRRNNYDIDKEQV